MRVSDIYELHDIYLKCSGAVTDSRKTVPGAMFFALKGDNFDGNLFADAALQAGASFAVVSDPSMDDDRHVVVDDVLKTMQDLARAHRAWFAVKDSGLSPMPVIALTGTNGKTTTKELIKAVLSVKYSVLATEGNLNNHIGVPLTLLGMKPEHDIAVIEMGASAPGEIRDLASIALPNYGLITNVGKAHLQGFGSFEGVKKTKGELYDYIQRTADKVFINADNPHLREMAALRPDLQTIPYGLSFSGAELLPVSASEPYLGIRMSDGTCLHTRLVGAYNADNVMAALAVGGYFGVPREDALRAIAAYSPQNSRSQLMTRGGSTFIVDAYNANPTSMAAAIANLAAMQSDRKAVLLGDMLELGEDSLAEHKAVAMKVAGAAPQLACFVGKEFAAALADPDVLGSLEAAGTKVLSYPDSASLAASLDRSSLEGFLVLVKGSRGMKMESVL